MHRFLVESEGWHADRVVFSAAQAHQIAAVLRLKPGDHVRVFDGQRPCDRLVELTSASDGRLLPDEVRQAAEARTRLIVCPSLLPRDKFELVLQKLTEVGVSRIVPVVCERSVVREMPDERRLSRWRAILREAAEQSGRGRVPELSPPEPFGQAVASAPDLRLLAYAAEPGLSLVAALTPDAPLVSVFVGPEGDFSPGEVARACEAGARIVSLGPRILRAETASLVLAALVLYELEGRST
jgi:16S rRNA (uracil1498-N3)-methyltransferase